MKSALKKWRQPQILRYEEGLKNENIIKNKDNFKKEDNIKYDHKRLWNIHQPKFSHKHIVKTTSWSLDKGTKSLSQSSIVFIMLGQGQPPGHVKCSN